MNDQICATCLKPEHLCVCAAVQPVETRLFVLILQHPQEKREALGTAHIAHLQIANSTLRTGLSWPNLKRILGQDVDHRRWAVLYLGPASAGNPEVEDEVSVVDKAGKPLADSAAVLSDLDGIILLDGTWSQAKTLWWRNPWLLKCRRIVLRPRARSLYGQARREPRRESVSTLEAAALVLSAVEGDPGLSDRLLAPFRLLLTKTRAPRPRQAPGVALGSAGAGAETGEDGG